MFSKKLSSNSSSSSSKSLSSSLEIVASVSLDFLLTLELGWSKSYRIYVVSFLLSVIELQLFRVSCVSWSWSRLRSWCIIFFYWFKSLVLVRLRGLWGLRKSVFSVDFYWHFLLELHFYRLCILSLSRFWELLWFLSLIKSSLRSN